MDVLLSSTYASSDDSLTETDKVQLAKISFVSKNKARFSVTAMRGLKLMNTSLIVILLLMKPIKRLHLIR